MTLYANPIKAGIESVASLGDGYTIAVKWFQALPTVLTNKIAYNIYYSTDNETVYDDIKFISIDSSLEANSNSLLFLCF